jgi:hypothetical protein
MAKAWEAVELPRLNGMRSPPGQSVSASDLRCRKRRLNPKRLARPLPIRMIDPAVERAEVARVSLRLLAALIERLRTGK